MGGRGQGVARQAEISQEHHRILRRAGGAVRSQASFDRSRSHREGGQASVAPPRSVRSLIDWSGARGGPHYESAEIPDLTRTAAGEFGTNYLPPERAFIFGDRASPSGSDSGVLFCWRISSGSGAR